ncbi:MAG: hypothetical protein L3K00_00670 [Thermoplasmata archaeon]|nr:hypothetical protein [Thermoplasmata archaeon]
MATALVTVALALLVLPLPAASAGAVRTTAAAPAPGPSESWAWGALANFSASIEYVGAYNNSQNLTGGNWTSSGAYVAMQESVGVEFGAYVLVNASTPSNGTRYVQVDAAELRAEHIAVAASGTFPVAGNYTANASIPLAPLNFSLAATVAVLDVAAAYLNFSTGPNGSLALANEHVEYAEGVNISLDAQQFPNVTRDAAGDVGIRYVTESIAASAWVFENLSATFSPALPLVEGPLFVGKTWNGTSTASFNGSVAWAETVHATTASGTTGAFSTSGTASARATVPVALQCGVTGTAVVRYPNGTPETDDVIACTNATGAAASLSTNGLVVLPTTNSTATGGLASTVPVHAATAPAAPNARAEGASLYSPSRQMATSERASPASGDQVTASPMSVADAKAAMHALGAPVRPVPVHPEGPELAAIAVVVDAVILVVGALVVLARRQRLRA